MARKHIPKKIKDEISKLSKGACEYCKWFKDFSPPGFACEHIIPLFREGTDELENLADSCFACNMPKHTFTTALDPFTNQTVPLFHPRKDNWNDHFNWSNDLLKMEGLTPTGRATILRLKTNREATVNLRRVLIGNGHPPD